MLSAGRSDEGLRTRTASCTSFFLASVSHFLRAAGAVVQLPNEVETKMFEFLLSAFLIFAFGTLTLWLAIKMSPQIDDTDENKMMVAATINAVGVIFSILCQLFPIGPLPLACFVVQIVLWFFMIHKFMECPWWYSIILFIGWIVLMMAITMALGIIMALIFGAAIST